MTTTYNPINHSPEEFHQRFIENYEQWQEHGFSKTNELDPREHPKDPVTTIYSGGTRKGVLQKAYAKVIIKPFSEKRTFSRRKTEDLGSVIIAVMSSSDLRLALTDLQKLTRIKLKKISKD